MRKSIPILAAVVLLVLLAVRFVNLTEDPALYYSGYGQTLLTDPYHLTFYARNAVLFGDWNPFDYHRWDVFKNSLVSGVAFLTFEAFGVSRVTANLAALIMSCGGLLFFLLGFRDTRRLSEIALTAGVLLLNNSLFLYGRLPFLETGLIFLAGLLFFVFMRYHDRWWGQALSGVLVALAALAGKLFGFILIVPVAAALCYLYRSKALLPLAYAAGGLLVGGAVYVLALYGGDFATAISYYREHTTGMYPSPPGFAGITAFFKMLITYGGESGVWDLMTIQLVLVTLGAMVAILQVTPFAENKKEHLGLIFLLVWLFAGIVGLSPFFYRPARYALFLMLPSAALIGFVVRFVWDRGASLRLSNRSVSLPFFFFISWYTFTQFRMIVVPVGRKFKTGVEFMPLAALFAAAITLIVYLLLQQRKSLKLWRWTAYGMAVLVAGMVSVQGFLIWKALVDPGTNLEQYNRELSMVVSPEAVLTGPYMPALTIDNNLKGVIYVFGLSDGDKDLFTRFGVSHVLANSANWQSAIKEFPQLVSSTQIAQFLISDQVVGLYRIENATAPLTDFERGAIDMLSNRFDSALAAFDRFSAVHPNTILGETRLAMAMTANGLFEEADDRLQSVAANNSGSYMAHVTCQAIYQKMYQVTNNSLYLKRAKEQQEVAESIDPANPTTF